MNFCKLAKHAISNAPRRSRLFNCGSSSSARKSAEYFEADDLEQRRQRSSGEKKRKRKKKNDRTTRAIREDEAWQKGALHKYDRGENTSTTKRNSGNGRTGNGTSSSSVPWRDTPVRTVRTYSGWKRHGLLKVINEGAKWRYRSFHTHEARWFTKGKRKFFSRSRKRDFSSRWYQITCGNEKELRWEILSYSPYFSDYCLFRPLQR